jgi:Domain of Unknown Function (DUF748)
MHWLRRHSRLAFIALALVLSYTLVGFFLLPYIIKSHIIPRVAEQLHRPVLVGDVEVNPFALSLRVIGFEIREVDHSPVLGFEEFFINFQAISLIHQAYVFDTIRLVLPYVSAKVSKEGRLNLLDLLPPENEPQPAAPPQDEKAPSQVPAIEISEFEIAQGVVEFRDESKPKPYALEIVPIHIALKNFYTKPGGDNSYAFTAELGKGETLEWEGTIALEPIRSEGTLSLSGVKLATFWNYVRDQYNFDLTAGTLQVKGRYRFDTATSPPDLRVFETGLHLSDIQLNEKGEADPIKVVPTLDVEGFDLDFRGRKVAIESVAMADGTDRVWINPDKSVNFATIFNPVKTNSTAEPLPSSPSSASAVPGEQGGSWTILIRDAHVTNHTIHFEDRSLPTPAQITIAALTAETSDVHIPLKGRLSLSVAMQVNETGQIHVKGSVVPTPFQADLTLGLKEIAIKPFQPYLEKFARIDVLSGAVNVDGDLHLAVQHPRGPFLSYEGNANVSGLAIADQDQGNEVASMKKFTLNTIRLTVDPTSLSIREVGLQEPAVHLVVQSDGGLNLAKLKSSEPSPAEQKPAPTEKSKSTPVSVTIGTVKLLKAAATFRDETLLPPVNTGISDFTGTIKGLSSKQLARADVDLAGRVDGVAPLKIVGTINPLSEDAFTDLAITFQNLDLTAEGPYSRKYVGYELSKGKLSFDLKYKVSQKSLEAENKVLVDQLTFGEKTDSPDATSIPVPFVVALLQDRQGRIEVDLPIRGDLNDPDFKYGRVLLSTLGNLLTKMVASPFALVGKLVPGSGSGEELQFFEFQPGSAKLAATELKKAEALITALQERPGLRLEITGTADPVRDRQALRLQKLKAQLLATWQQERASPKETDLPVAEEERLIKERFKQQQSQQAGAAPPTKPDVAPKPPTVEEMRQQLAASISVDEASLRSLADERAKQMRDQLAGEGKLAVGRVFLTEVDVTASGREKVRSRLNITAGS